MENCTSGICQYHHVGFASHHLQLSAYGMQGPWQEGMRPSICACRASATLTRSGTMQTQPSLAPTCSWHEASALTEHASPVKLMCSDRAGALARGDAAINLRFPRRGYREKIWDHAAGALIVQEAGGKISDASGERSLAMYACESPYNRALEPHWDEIIGAIA